ncbi:MAG: hypothetical protein HYY84_15300 [Deltaproteobacteria bacterium]|nr:hypothetical protein [Deltaproteobacteria bacterium]
MKHFCAAAFAICAVALSANAVAAPKKPFYVIAHMTNTLHTVRWAMAEGANALEMDLRFTSSGTPDSFRHGFPCDCSCPVLQRSVHVCGPLSGCNDSARVNDMFHLLATQPRLALVILDTKITAADSVAMQEEAGRQIVQKIDSDLFGRGYGGKVIISAAHTDVMAYVQSAVTTANASSNKARIFFAYDQVGGEAEDAVCALRTLMLLPTSNRAFGTGIAACASGNYRRAVEQAARNQSAGVIGFVYAWTLDDRDPMRSYIDHGAQGIMTNVPRNLVAVAREKGLTLARPSDPIPAATSNEVRGSANCSCDCDYHPGGCVVSRPAPRGRACKCSYKGAWTCGGSLANCRDLSSPRCKNPDTSVASCVQGGGDCDGYKKATCDCNYERGGCYISKVAPKGTACKCKYKGAWTCGGSVVKCNNPTSPKCANPDASKASCLLGGGDCDAKRYK